MIENLAPWSQPPSLAAAKYLKTRGLTDNMIMRALQALGRQPAAAPAPPPVTPPWTSTGAGVGAASGVMVPLRRKREAALLRGIATGNCCELWSWLEKIAKQTWWFRTGAF